MGKEGVFLNYGIIEYTRPEDGYDYISGWEDSDYAIFSNTFLVCVGIKKLKVGDIANSGGFVFEVIDEEMGDFIVKRIDNKIQHFFSKKWFFFVRWIKFINYRLLRTAMIWNLIDPSYNVIASWKNLKVLKWIFK